MKLTLKDLDSERSLVATRKGESYSVQYRSIYPYLYFPNIKYIDYITFALSPLKRVDFDLVFENTASPNSSPLGICIYIEGIPSRYAEKSFFWTRIPE